MEYVIIRFYYKCWPLLRIWIIIACVCEKAFQWIYCWEGFLNAAKYLWLGIWDFKYLLCGVTEKSFCRYICICLSKTEKKKKKGHKPQHKTLKMRFLFNILFCSFQILIDPEGNDSRESEWFFFKLSVTHIIRLTRGWRT